MRADRTIDAKERAVLEALAQGPADTAGSTYRHRLRHGDPTARDLVQFVELKAARRLAQAGLVHIDPGGRAELTAEGRKELEHG